MTNCLDLSEVAPSLIDSTRRQAAVSLKEVLDRIALPAAAEIPDASAAAAESLSRWRVPHSEITLVRLTEGPRAGEWVFSADTVARAEDFFRVVEHLPYRADAGSLGLHDMYVEAPGWMIAEAWIRRLPAWARRRAWDVTIWQWSAAAALLAAGSGLVVGAFVAARRVAGRPGAQPLMLTLVAPLVLVGTCLACDEAISNQIRITGPALVGIKTALRVGMFVGCIILVQAVLTRLGETVIRSRRLRPGTIDTQVVRLGFQTLTVLAMAWIVILGADSMGVSVAPLYETTADQMRHVLAGLRRLFANHPRIDAESLRVRFIGYGACSLDIEVFALAETNDWATFLAIQEDALLKVMDVIRGSGCSFAVQQPPQTLAAAA